MSGLELMKKRMNFEGGATSDGRNVKGKYLSFKSALGNSYQAEWITFNENKYRCLINPDKQTVDYDQKEISIDFVAGMKPGDVFYWDRTNSYWLVYLQKFEEEAYFRANIRQCQYQINGWWVYLRGPVETALVWRQKHQIMMNDMNLSILIYVVNTEETNEFFTRFQKVKFDGHTWRVAATDRYSQPGIIEVYLEEFFDNEMEDKQIIPEIIEPDVTQPFISGPQEVSAYDKNLKFSINGANNGEFIILENSSKVKIKSADGSSCIIDILSGKSTEFILGYSVDGGTTSAAQLKVRVKSL